MAISKEKTAECLGRLQLLKWFPPSSYALAELGRILNEICADDTEASAVVRLILEKHDESARPAQHPRCTIRSPERKGSGGARAEASGGPSGVARRTEYA